MKPVVFLRSARADLQDEFDYYGKIDTQLASRFKNAVASAVRLMSVNPEAMQALEAEVRRWPLRGFPHGVLYRLGSKQIVVLAVFHPKQDPKKWKRRLGGFPPSA